MQRRFWIELLLMVAGPVIWLAHFLFIYMVNAVACAHFPSGGVWMALPVSSWIILAASALALAGMAAVSLYQRRRVRTRRLPRFHGWLTGSLCLLSAVAVLWETLPVLTAAACG
ncbi:hypothetical protein AVE30378_02475 [Achromobacter veterisilvae]|uniref:Uncharacterized protein n=1 Tax=Achromobacter veterisilvae TaxID=2069367 RepID=A0A446CHB4_9BURK|nr:hypothetical protein [Achromobacter veterisilvae]SSW67153.1 hypothetical protein AVE30378_02475 [Achromobacter veterisilvae]